MSGPTLAVLAIALVFVLLAALSQTKPVCLKAEVAVLGMNYAWACARRPT